MPKRKPSWERALGEDLTNQVRTWEAAMVDMGHTPIMNDRGYLDFFAHDQGNHNGPACATCGWSVCWHCNPDPLTAVTECEKRKKRPRKSRGVKP